jgi:hypothetical protein
MDVQLLIGGQDMAAASRNTFERANPVTGELVRPAPRPPARKTRSERRTPLPPPFPPGRVSAPTPGDASC